VRFNQNGTPDAGFGTGGRIFIAASPTYNVANAVAIQPDGKIVIVGSTTPASSSVDFLVVRLTAAGALDTTFGTNGIVTLNQGSVDRLEAVAVQPDGKIVVAGSTSDAGGQSAVLRFTANGSLDVGFANGGLLFRRFTGSGSENLQSLALLSNGRILTGGLSDNFPNQPTTFIEYLLALEPNGSLASDFGNQGIVFNTTPLIPNFPNPSRFDLAILPGDRIVTVSNYRRRYLSNGTPDTSVANGGFGGTNIAARPDGRFVVINIPGGLDVTNPSQNIPGFGLGLYSSANRFIGKSAAGGADVAVQPDNKIVVLSFDANNFVLTRIASITSQGTKLADYDRDERTDYAVLRPSNSTLYVLNNQGAITAYNSGEPGFEVRRVIPEIDNCNSSAPFVYYRWNGNIEGSSAGFVRNNGAGSRAVTQFGVIGDIPVGGDYDGNGCTDFTVFRPQNGTWYILTNPERQFRAVQFGQNGDKPVPADYDYDGITDIAVFRPSNGAWYVSRSSDNQFQAVQFGQAGDIPLTGDFDGDGRADFTVYRPSNGTWYSLQTTNGFRAAQFGISTDQPVPGDYDGDGRHDFAVFRDGYWYILGSTRGFYAVQWGLPSDTPVAVRYAY
jgi:uncharacterized delta-60 repeat protein